MENDEILALTMPTTRYSDKLREYKEEFAAAGEDYNAGPQYSGESNTFLYIRESDDRIVGMANIRPDGSEYGNIGYAIRPSERGKGYGERIVDAVSDLCGVFGMEDIVALCYEDNRASAHVLELNDYTLVDKEIMDGRTVLKYRLRRPEDNDG